ncbi:MAG: 4-alpha-glucanotransferase [Methylococcaceae bacterium]|nr:4-alpha-glucanotransferase [Methylococcaceae bacterium]
MEILLEQRRAGVLLHITSLPGKYGNGDMGEEAYHFIKFLRDSGITVWQTLPLGVPHGDGSPYQCLSAHAGNPALISLDWLEEKGWLQTTERCNDCDAEESFTKKCLLTKSFYGFQALATQDERDEFKQFSKDKAFWLDDYALFMAFRSEFGLRCWNEWPEDLKQRKPKAINEAKQRLQQFIENIQFEQYVFFKQWHELKTFAEENDILLLGDIPIFVSYDSVDVWVNRKVFKLDEMGEMSVVSGVPPDYFSKTGQRWGNPHYDWEYLEKTGFQWWLERLQTQLEMFDIIRIDHFRGLEAAWEVPAENKTAMKGAWIKAPGEALLSAIQTAFDEIPLVAEDLGIITDEVDKLRNDFKLPGMKILQFAFGDNAKNPYLPHNYQRSSVVYTGTHDNDTTLGWYHLLTDEEKHYIYEILGMPTEPMPWALIQAAFSSVSNLAVIPMQDILELGSEDRMNVPGTMNGNWQWRFTWDQLTDDRANKLAHLVRLFGR